MQNIKTQKVTEYQLPGEVQNEILKHIAEMVQGSWRKKYQELTLTIHDNEFLFSKDNKVLFSLTRLQ